MKHCFSNVVDDYDYDSTTETAIILLPLVRVLAMCFPNGSPCSDPNKFERHKLLVSDKSSL